MAVSYDGKSVNDGHGYQAHVGPMRATSRGHVKLKSASPSDHPEILFNYMGTEQDREEMRSAIRLTREVMGQDALKPFRGEELAPGPHVQSNTDIDAFIRAFGESAYHPCGTCKMGAADDPLSVVGEDLKVHGVQDLRVVDASIIMIAEKAADFILGKTPLPPSTAATYQAENWQTSQR